MIICIFLLVAIFLSFFYPSRGVPKKLVFTKDFKKVLTKAEALEDLEYIMNRFKERHPACIKGIPEAVSKKYQIEKDNITDKVSVLKLWQTASRILAIMKDGHTGVNYYSIEYYTLPMTFSFSKGILTCTNGKYKSYTVTRINKLSPSELYRNFTSQFSFEIESYAEYYFAEYIVSNTFLEFIGVDTSSDIEFSFTAGGKEETAFYSFKKLNLYYSAEDLFVTFDIDTKNSIGVFTLKQCKFNEKYRDTLKAFFKDVKKHRIQSIVVDLRNNSGGNSMVCDEFIRYLDLDLDKYHSTYTFVRFGPLLKKYKNEFLTNKQYKDLLFNGRVYVLTSTSTFSAAMNFASILSDNKIGVVVGEIPGNMPSSYGNILEFQTPNSKLCFTISSKFFIRADESKRYLPLIPDYNVSAETALDKVEELCRRRNWFYKNQTFSAAFSE
jgi:hypothetical protein